MIDRRGQTWIREGNVFLVLSTQPSRVLDVLKDHSDDHTILAGFCEHEVIDLTAGTLVAVRENQDFAWETRDYWVRVL